MSQASALQLRTQVQQVFRLSLRMVLFLTIPASIGLMVLGEPVIRLFFQRGTFDDQSTRATAYAMVFFAIGLAGHATVEIVDRVFYALHDTRSPVRVAVGAIAVNVVLSLILMQIPLTYGDGQDGRFGWLALANSIAALLEAAVLLRLISTRMPDLDVQGLARSGLRILAASLLMGLPLAWLASQLDPLLRPYGGAGQTLLLAVCVSAGALLYALLSLAFRSDELYALWRLVRK
jgi:putative peptidoglycan lipid II flippase